MRTGKEKKKNQTTRLELDEKNDCKHIPASVKKPERIEPMRFQERLQIQ